MIIEFTNQKPGFKSVCLLHYDPQKDKIKNVENVTAWLVSANYAVLPVPCGQPCPTNPLPKVQIFNGDNEALLNVIAKIQTHSKPGAMIPLNEEEFSVWKKAQESGEVISL